MPKPTPTPIQPATVPGIEPADAATLDALDQAARRQLAVRCAVAAGFVLIGAALLAPALPPCSLRRVVEVVTVALAAVGGLAIYQDAARWISVRYTLDRSAGWRPWRWSPVRRWHAPGAAVRLRMIHEVFELQHWGFQAATSRTPAVVIEWAHDPTTRKSWALAHFGTQIGPQWVPLAWLTPAADPEPTGSPVYHPEVTS